MAVYLCFIADMLPFMYGEHLLKINKKCCLNSWEIV